MKEIVFNQTSDFEANNALENWCKQNNYSIGIMQSPAPRAIYAGKVFISKWRNLSDKERSNADAVAYGDFRNGPITVKFKREIPNERD